MPTRHRFRLRARSAFRQTDLSSRRARPRQHRARQRGATLIEFVAVAMPLLLLGTLIVEAAYWQMARQIAYVALLDSARAAATHLNRAEAMERAFIDAFLPRLATLPAATDEHPRQTGPRVPSRAGMPAWRIEILQPEDPDWLHSRLTYLHAPLSPVTRGLLRRIGRPDGGCIRQAWSQGLLPIRLSLDIERHTRASKDAPSMAQTRKPDARVVYGEWHCP